MVRPMRLAAVWVAGRTQQCLQEQGAFIYEVLEQNNSYHALRMWDGLIVAGPTDTNVNDVVVALIN